MLEKGSWIIISAQFSSLVLECLPILIHSICRREFIYRKQLELQNAQVAEKRARLKAALASGKVSIHYILG
jgi:hypothetical protein